MHIPLRSQSLVLSRCCILRLACSTTPQQSPTIGTPPKLAPPTSNKNTPRLNSAAPSSSSTRVQLIANHFSSSATARSDTKMPSFGVRRIGAPNTLEHRVFIEMDGAPVSSFHDVPLYANEQQTVLNMIVEIPRWTNAKLEVRSSSH